MNIDPIKSTAASFEAMADLQKQMTDMKLAFDDKMLRVEGAELEQATGASGIDTFA